MAGLEVRRLRATCAECGAVIGEMVRHPHVVGNSPEGARDKLSWLAVASLISGITLILFPLAIVLGHLAHWRIRRVGQRGDLAASIGIGLGYLVVANFAAVVLIALMAGLLSN